MIVRALGADERQAELPEGRGYAIAFYDAQADMVRLARAAQTP